MGELHDERSDASVLIFYLCFCFSLLPFPLSAYVVGGPDQHDPWLWRCQSLMPLEQGLNNSKRQCERGSQLDRVLANFLVFG